MGDFAKRKKPRKSGTAIVRRPCCGWSQLRLRRSLGWQAPQDVQQFGRFAVEINQSAHVVLDAKHHFIASAVHLVDNPDHLLALAGEPLALTRDSFRLFVRRRAGFSRWVFSVSHDR